MRPSELLARLVRGAVANVDFVDAQHLMEALGFEELRVRGSHHIYARSCTGATQLARSTRAGQALPASTACEPRSSE